MSIDSEQVALVETPPELPAAPPPLAYPPAPVFAPAYETPVPAPVIAAPKKARPAWILPAAIAVVGLIASGSLGYLFYSTNQKLQDTQSQLTETQLTLDKTQKDLAAEKAQTAYVRLFETDMGRESTDFAVLVECDGYSSCKSATRDFLSDTEAFQNDHQSAKVPPQFANVDSMLGDALTAEIAALKDLESALNKGDMTKVQDGFGEVNDATLSLFKTQAALGRAIS